MERKGLIFAILLLATTLLAQMPESKNSFETGTLMVLSKRSAVIDESRYALDANVEIVDVNGTRVPIDFVKLPALCKFQTNLMRGEISDSVKIVKIIIMRPIKQREFRIKREKE